MDLHIFSIIPILVMHRQFMIILAGKYSLRYPNISGEGVEDHEILIKRLPCTYGEEDKIFANSPTEHDDPGKKRKGELPAGAPEVEDQPPYVQPTSWLRVENIYAAECRVDNGQQEQIEPTQRSFAVTKKFAYLICTT